MKESFFLFFYATCKAFLPLPSLEVVLLPLYAHKPYLLWWYAFLGAIGTFVGGSIGYIIALLIKEEKWERFFGKEQWEKGKELIHKHGVFAIFIGGITPIPDFLLAYVAGFVRMNYIQFACIDGIARFLRSILVLYTFEKLGILIDLDTYGMYFIYIFIVYAIFKYIFSFFKNKHERKII